MLHKCVTACIRDLYLA